MSHVITRYVKANKYIEHYHKDKESSYFMYWGANNLYRWVISQELPVNNFKWVKKQKVLIKQKPITIMRTIVKDNFLKLILNILSIYKDNTMIYHFCPKE